MLAIVGVVLVIGMVFGGYLLAGGKFGIILKALPFEMMMIGGAAAGTFLIANKGDVVKGALGDMKRVVAGPKWKREDYRDLLSLMFMVVKLLKSRGPLVLEVHVEKPHESALFGRYPKIRDDHFALDFMADTLRMTMMSVDDPYQVEECMQRQLKKHHAELHARAAALQSIADGTDAEDLRVLLEDELTSTAARNRTASRFYMTLGGFAPTVGIIGTVVSLTHVLEKLDKPDTKERD